MNDMELAASIAEMASACGYAVCGIVKIEDMRGYAGAIAARIAKFPEATPMYTPFSAFAEPEAMAPWAKSVIICGHWQGKYRIPENLQGLIGKTYCVDTRKNAQTQESRGRQQFEQALAELGLKYASKRDFGITALRWAAAQAGLGVIRKNNFFYAEKGSWYGLDSFLIDRELELKTVPKLKSCPAKCDLCQKACPTGALPEPFQTNGVACVSYLTTMATCRPGKKHYDKCGSWLFGCDACQDACPFNQKAWSGGEDFPGLAELAEQISYEQILAMDYETMRRLLPPKFWYIPPELVWKWKSNALNAMANNYQEQYLPYIVKARQDSQAEVREMAEWVWRLVKT